MFTGFCSYNKEQKAFKNEQKEKWDGDRKKISDQKIAGRSGTISAYGDGTGVPLHGTGGAVRKEGEDYVLTYKSKGLMVREEYNLPLTKESYEHLLEKADGTVITKTRYRIPEKNGLTIELDVFHGRYGGLFLAEVEFATEEEANSYCPPEWFGEDVTMSSAYHNSTLSQKK